ncbi:MAG TPA: alpha-amylase family glycosyl hydrolase [Opitutales bacterium]|nr:alpha-amylase family glycosyl hydrolase [Opitutales bacterium]
MSDLWFKTAIIYCVDVDAYMDGDGDGAGDFIGLTKRLDYIAGLGVTCIWLLPFYPTPNRDNGYDISDYYGVNPRVGTLGDFVCFLREATDRGIKVIVDLVINHTSDQHPWFQAAHSDRNSPYRDFYVWRNGRAVLLGEVNVEPTELEEFLYEGRRMHMAFNFLVNKNLMLAMAEKSAEPLHRIWKTLPVIPSTTQWVHFARNLDEVNLTHLLESEKEKVFEAFAPDDDMRIFGRGIRRRLPPMLKGDRKRLELIYSAILTMPGTPTLVYGEEIGMGDDLSMPGRNSVRTPMQWADEPNADFSSAPREKLYRSIINSGPFSYKKVNVPNQQRDENSLLSWMIRAIRIRKECPEFGRGELEILSATPADALFCHIPHFS